MDKQYLQRELEHLNRMMDIFERAEKLEPMVADHEARLEFIKSEIDHHEQVKIEKRDDMAKLREQIEHDKKKLLDDFDAYVKDTHAKMKENESQILAELDPLHDLHNTLVSDVQAKKLELSSLEERIALAKSKLAELKGV